MNKELLIKKSKDEAIKNLRHFFELLGYNSDAFNHLYNIPMKIGHVKDGYGEYDTKNNVIILDREFIDDMLYYIDSDGNNEVNVILNIAEVIVHEMIHVNRSLLNTNGINLGNLEEKANLEENDIEQKNNGYNVELLNKYLDSNLKLPYLKDSKPYIPVKCTFNNDGTYTIIAYERNLKVFDVFEHQFLSLDKSSNESFLKSLSYGLNNLNSNLVISKTLFDKNVIYPNSKRLTDKKIRLASDYYHNIRNDGKILNEEEIEKNNSTKQMNTRLVNILNRIKNSRGFEELITESLANIVIMSRDDLLLNLDKIVERIKNSDIEIQYAATLDFINIFGINMIKWFMLSPYDEYYIDEMENIYNEKYDQLLYCFSNIYDSLENDDINISLHIDNLKKIVKENIRIGQRR